MNKKLLSGTGLLLALGLFIAINIIANGTLTSMRVDVTANRLYTLSPGTRNILGDLKEPITLRFYFSQKQLSGIPDLMNYGNRVRDMLEEYAAESHGMLKLTVTDPEPFSEAEDQAVAHGLRQLPLSAGGDVAYFGLVASNTTDDETNIPFFNPKDETSLEYDLTKLIYNLAHPKKRVIGVISSLPVFGSGPRGQPWTVIQQLKGSFDVRDLGAQPQDIDDDVDTLMVIHPKDLPVLTEYAIDQFVIHGGRAMVFVDPMAETDASKPDPKNPLAMPKISSDLPKLFKNWGLELVKDKIATAPDLAIRVNYTGPRGPAEVDYLPWLRLQKPEFNQDDFTTNQLKQINLGTAGILKPLKGAKTTFTPLFQTPPKAMAYDRDAVMFVRDPNTFLEQFKSGNKPLVLAARITGPLESAFPKGRPIIMHGPKGRDPAFLKVAKTPINIVVVADTDILTDRFWVQVQDYLGVHMPKAIADNGDFIVNTIDNLGGSDDLISLRSRKQYERPFIRVQNLRKQAETEFRDQERSLQAKLKQTEAKLGKLQQQQAGKKGALLSEEQKKEIENFRQEQVRTRKQLRGVQHDLVKNIEGLGSILKFINIGLVPLLIGLLAILVALIRATGRRRPA